VRLILIRKCVYFKIGEVIHKGGIRVPLLYKKTISYWEGIKKSARVPT
jgi:hypothetical protein